MLAAGEGFLVARLTSADGLAFDDTVYGRASDRRALACASRR